MCIKRHGNKTVHQTAEEEVLLHVVCHLPFRSLQEYFKKSIVNVNFILSISVRIRSNRSLRCCINQKCLNHGEKESVFRIYESKCCWGGFQRVFIKSLCTYVPSSDVY